MSYSLMVQDIADKLPAGGAMRFAVEIVGLPYVFTEDTFNSSAFTSLFGSYRSAVRALVFESVEVGEFKLDTRQRRVTSATAWFSIAQDVDGYVASVMTPRAKPIARVKAYSNAADTTITTTLDSRSVSNTPIYIGGETVRATSWSGGTLTCARGQYGSTAIEHFGGTDGIGVNIYAAPQNMINREVNIWGYCLDEKGAPPMSHLYYGTIYTGRIIGTPEFREGQWSFELEHATESIASTEYGVGLRALELDGEAQVANRANANAFWFDSGDSAYWENQGLMSAAVIDGGDGSYLLPIVDGSDETDLTIDFDNGFALSYAPEWDGISEKYSWLNENLRSRSAKGITHAALVQGDAAEVVLFVLCSATGDGSASDYDVLSGRVRTEYGGVFWRHGAGLADFVNSEVFTAEAGTGPPFLMVIKEPGKVGNLLQWYCAAKNKFWFVSRDSGAIAIGEMSDVNFADAADYTITKANTLAESPRIEVEQGPGLHAVTLKASFDAVVGKHMATIQSHDAEIAAQYGDKADTYEIDMGPVNVDVTSSVSPDAFRGALKRSGGMSIAEAESLTRRLQVESTIGRMFVTVALPINWAVVDIGDVVQYTDDRVPDGEGSTLSSAKMICVGYEPDWRGGVVRLRLMKQRSGWRFAPAAKITAWNAGTKTLTLSTTWDGIASPGLNFPAGADVYLYNTSTGTLDYATVLSCTATTVAFDLSWSPSSWTYTANESYLVFDAGGPTPAGYSTGDFAHMQEADANVGDSLYSEWG